MKVSYNKAMQYLFDVRLNAGFSGVGPCWAWQRLLFSAAWGHHGRGICFMRFGASLSVKAIVVPWGLGLARAWSLLLFREAWSQYGRECDCCFVGAIMGLSQIVVSWGLGPSWAWVWLLLRGAWGHHGRGLCLRLGASMGMNAIVVLWGLGLARVIRGRNRLGASLPWPLLLCATVMVMDRISLWLWLSEVITASKLDRNMCNS
jgi:hypothetical protein